MADLSPWDDVSNVISQPSYIQQPASAFYEAINQSSYQSNNQAINQTNYPPAFTETQAQPFDLFSDPSLTFVDNYQHRGDEDVHEDIHGNEVITTNQFIRRFTQIMELQQQIPLREAAIDQEADSLGRIIRLKTRAFNPTYSSQCNSQRLSAIRARLEHERHILDEQREQVKARRVALIERTRSVRDQLIQVLQHRQIVSQHQPAFFKKLETASLRNIVVLSVRHRSMIQSLLSIYPIQILPPPLRTPDDTLAIRGCKLPNINVHQSDDESTSTALSYVAHLVMLLSSYFDVPLRYRPIYRSARSSIADELVSHSIFPLYVKGADRDKLETGLMLINNDIDQLIHACMNHARCQPLRRNQFNQAARLASRQLSGRGHNTLERLKHLTDILMVLG